MTMTTVRYACTRCGRRYFLEGERTAGKHLAVKCKLCGAVTWIGPHGVVHAPPSPIRSIIVDVVMTVVLLALVKWCGA